MSLPTTQLRVLVVHGIFSYSTSRLNFGCFPTMVSLHLKHPSCAYIMNQRTRVTPYTCPSRFNRFFVYFSDDISLYNIVSLIIYNLKIYIFFPSYPCPNISSLRHRTDGQTDCWICATGGQKYLYLTRLLAYNKSFKVFLFFFSSAVRLFSVINIKIMEVRRRYVK